MNDGMCEPVLESMKALQRTPRQLAAVLREMRRRIGNIADNEGLSREAKMEQMAAARVRAAAKVDQLYEAGARAKQSVERALTASCAAGHTVHEGVEQELVVGWQRLTLAVSYTRHEVSGGGGMQTIWPDWRKSAVITV